MNFSRKKHDPFKARAPRRQVGTMNKTEARYAQTLDLDPTVKEYRFEEFKFRLAAGTYWTPDFVVFRDDDSMEIHEVKGFWRDDARVKIKVCAAQFSMFKIIAVSWKAKQWQVEEF